MAITLSRERSWLRFNHRVLLQTQRDDIPLLEKVRFLAIYANNHDEFFAARIYRAVAESRGGDPEARAEYEGLMKEAYAAAVRASEIHEELRAQLHDAGFFLLEPGQLTPTERAYFGAFLAEEVSPRADLLDATAIGELSSRALYLAAGEERLRYLIRLPDSVPRLFSVPGRPEALIRLGPLVRTRPDLFLPEELPMYEMRLTRLANLDLERADWDDLYLAIESRPEGRPTRLEVETAFPWAEQVRKELHLPRAAVFRLPAPLDHRYLNTVADLQPARKPSEPPLRFPPARFRRRRKFIADPFARVADRDIALYHPLDDYGMVEHFVEKAASDPEVDRIRISLYRLGRRNRIADSLIAAARSGKDVAVLLEGRARFDELQNLHWNLHFQQAGIDILPLPFGYKVHAKALLVRRAGKGYVHLGTGNYNPTNGRLYTDLSLFSSNAELVSDAESFFEALQGGGRPQLKHMLYGPGAREAMAQRIAAEGHPGGRVILKMNHLADQIILDALQDAAAAGAQIDMIIRSTLTLYDDRFRQRCIVGRFLEHPRLAAFRGDGSWDVWAGSADWMTRNFEDRIELLFPVWDRRIKRQIVRLLEGELIDDVNAFVLKPDGTHEPVWGGSHNSQMERL